MEELSAEMKAFLRIHPFFELTQDRKLKCTLNGHEFPCSVTELQKFTQAKKYKSLSTAADFNYSQFEPHIVPSTKQPNQLFCKLTLRHLNKQPHHVLKHVDGKRFKKALAKYEDCQKKGIEYVPARLKQKRPKDLDVDSRHGNSSKHANGMWEHTSSEGERSDSEDSMSDLYPSSLFTLKNSAEEKDEKCAKDEEFLTDEDEQMELERPVLERPVLERPVLERPVLERPVLAKRKKAQNSGFQKKFRNNNWRAARSKKQKKVPQVK